MLPPRWLLGSLVFLCAQGMFPGLAWAQPDELAELEGELARLETLLTEDCTTACKSLESMRRAAEHICELDPGARCDAARRKVADAAQRVRTACPECAAAGEREDDDGRDTVTRAQEPAETTELHDDSAPAAGPPAEERGAAGCGACTVGPSRDARWAPWLVLLGAAFGGARRRRR